jgi:hypothetical protein
MKSASDKQARNYAPPLWPRRAMHGEQAPAAEHHDGKEST